MNDADLDDLADAIGYFASSGSGPDRNVPASTEGAPGRGGVPTLTFFRRRRLRSVLRFWTEYQSRVLRVQFDPATGARLHGRGQTGGEWKSPEFERACILGLSHPESHQKDGTDGRFSKDQEVIDLTGHDRVPHTPVCSEAERIPDD